MTPARRVIVLGGYGRYGRYIARALAELDDIQVIVAGRKPPGRYKANSAIHYQKLDANDEMSLKTALADVFLLVNATGLFTGDSRYNVARLCAQTGTHYVDLADNREHISNFSSLAGEAEQQNVLLVTAAGVSPSLSALLADTLRPEFDRISSIRIYRSAGNRNPGGPASLRSLLEQIGSTVRVRQQGRWQNIDFWSNSQVVRFPKPIGRRRCFCVDAPELDALVERFNADSVIYRTGFELSIYNLGLKLISSFRKNSGVRQPGKLARWLLRFAGLTRGLGRDNDVLGVILGGEKDGRQVEHGAYLVAREGAGLTIPCASALALVEKLLQQGIPASGVARTQDIITFDDVRTGLSKHNVVLVRV